MGPAVAHNTHRTKQIHQNKNYAGRAGGDLVGLGGGLGLDHGLAAGRDEPAAQALAHRLHVHLQQLARRLPMREKQISKNCGGGGGGGGG